jgi:hypothetical protein
MAQRRRRMQDSVVSESASPPPVRDIRFLNISLSDQRDGGNPKYLPEGSNRSLQFFQANIFGNSFKDYIYGEEIIYFFFKGQSEILSIFSSD